MEEGRSPKGKFGPGLNTVPSLSDTEKGAQLEGSWSLGK